MKDSVYKRFFPNLSIIISNKYFFYPWHDVLVNTYGIIAALNLFAVYCLIDDLFVPESVIVPGILLIITGYLLYLLFSVPVIGALIFGSFWLNAAFYSYDFFHKVAVVLVIAEIISIAIILLCLVKLLIEIYLIGLNRSIKKQTYKVIAEIRSFSDEHRLTVDEISKEVFLSKYAVSLYSVVDRKHRSFSEKTKLFLMIALLTSSTCDEPYRHLKYYERTFKSIIKTAYDGLYITKYGRQQPFDCLGDAHFKCIIATSQNVMETNNFNYFTGKHYNGLYQANPEIIDYVVDQEQYSADRWINIIAKCYYHHFSKSDDVKNKIIEINNIERCHETYGDSDDEDFD